MIDATTGEFYLKNEINSIYTTEDNYPTFLDGVDGSTQFWQNEPNCKAATWAGVIKQNLYSDDSCSSKTSHNIYYSANLVSDTEMCFTGVNNWLDADRAYLDLKDVFHVKVTMDCTTFQTTLQTCTSDTYAARRSGLRALRAQASRAPCAQANEPRLRPRQTSTRTSAASARSGARSCSTRSSSSS